MHTENITIAFDDIPKMEELEAVISGWHRPKPLNRLENVASAFAAGGEGVIRQRLSKIQSSPLSWVSYRRSVTLRQLTPAQVGLQQ